MRLKLPLNLIIIILSFTLISCGSDDSTNSDDSANSEDSSHFDGVKVARSVWDNSFSRVESENFVVWWGDQKGDLTEAAKAVLIKSEETWEIGIEQFGMYAPPGADQYLINIYLVNSWGEDLLTGGPGVGTDTEDYPFLAFPYNMAEEILQDPSAQTYTISTIYHEIFHLFQYTPTNVLNIFPYVGDNAWYIESSANWFGEFLLPDATATKDPVAAYTLNPQLPLWASFDNQTFNYDEGDMGNWSRSVHQYGSYVYFIYLQEFVTTKAVVAKMIIDSWIEQTDQYPQEVIFDKLLTLNISMAETFADFAAHNVTWDYINNVDAYKYWESEWMTEMSAYGEANKTIASYTSNSGGWVTPPDGLVPAAWAYNVVELNPGVDSSILVEFNADELGSAGTASNFEVRVVIESADTPIYHSLTVTDGQASKSFTVMENETLWLIVASVPDLFSTNETFSYEYKIIPN